MARSDDGLMLKGRDWLMENLPGGSFIRFIFWTLYSLLFALFARVCVEYISPFAAGEKYYTSRK